MISRIPRRQNFLFLLCVSWLTFFLTITMEGGDEFFMDGIPEENEWGDFDAVPTHSAPAIPQETETPPQSHSPPQPQQPPQQRVQHTPPPGLGSGSGSGASQGLTPVHFNLGVGDCETEKSQFKFRVGEWKKSGEGMSAYVLFTIRCRTTAQGMEPFRLPPPPRSFGLFFVFFFFYSLFDFLVLGWTKIEITTERRYNEFCWLFKQLTKENPYCIVPPLPEKVYFLSFLNSFCSFSIFLFFNSLPSILTYHPFFFLSLSPPPPLSLLKTSLLNSKFDDDFLRQRGKELCRFMERVGAHPTLSQSSALKTFMTTNPLPESTQAPAKETPAPAPQSSSSSSGGWFSFLSNTVSNITTTSTTTKPVEVDVFFENKARYYKDLETTILSLADMSANYVANYRDRVFRANTFVDVCQRLSLAEGNSNTAGGGDVKVGNSYLHLMNVGTQRAIFDTQLGDSLRDTWESDLRDAQRQFQQVFLGGGKEEEEG